MTAVPMYFAAAYPPAVVCAHQAGAIRYAYSDENDVGGHRRYGTPCSATPRDCSAHSSSSVNSQGVECFVVCHA